MFVVVCVCDCVRVFRKMLFISFCFFSLFYIFVLFTSSTSRCPLPLPSCTAVVVVCVVDVTAFRFFRSHTRGFPPSRDVMEDLVLAPLVCSVNNYLCSHACRRPSYINTQSFTGHGRISESSWKYPVQDRKTYVRIHFYTTMQTHT